MKKLAFKQCDNTDCEHGWADQLVIRTTLIDDFNNDVCYWCPLCRERDEAMIEE